MRENRETDEVLVCMAQRLQSQLERQLTLVERLQVHGGDESLADLAELRTSLQRTLRGSENLLVLAGAQQGPRSRGPRSVADVLADARAGVDDVTRVGLGPAPDTSIAPRAVSGLVALFTELLAHGLAVAAPLTRVDVASARSEDGGVVVEVVVDGPSASAGELDELNRRLGDRPIIDDIVSNRVGLFVAARLARRCGAGLRVQHRRGPLAGSGFVVVVHCPPDLLDAVAFAAPDAPRAWNREPAGRPGNGHPANGRGNGNGQGNGNGNGHPANGSNGRPGSFGGPGSYGGPGSFGGPGSWGGPPSPPARRPDPLSDPLPGFVRREQMEPTGFDAPRPDVPASDGPRLDGPRLDEARPLERRSEEPFGDPRTGPDGSGGGDRDPLGTGAGDPGAEIHGRTGGGPGYGDRARDDQGWTGAGPGRGEPGRGGSVHGGSVHGGAGRVDAARGDLGRNDRGRDDLGLDDLGLGDPLRPEPDRRDPLGTGRPGAGAFESGATDSGAFESGATRPGAFESGATHSGAFESGATHSGAFESGAVDRARPDLPRREPQRRDVPRVEPAPFSAPPSRSGSADLPPPELPQHRTGPGLPRRDVPGLPRRGEPARAEGPSSGDPSFRDPASGDPASGDRPSGDRSSGGRPFGGRPFGGTPFGGTPFGAAASGGAPFGGSPLTARPLGGPDVHRPDPYRSDVQRPDPQRPDPQRRDLQRSDPQRPDPQRSDLQRSEVQRSEVQRSEVRSPEHRSEPLWRDEPRRPEDPFRPGGAVRPVEPPVRPAETDDRPDPMAPDTLWDDDAPLTSGSGDAELFGPLTTSLRDRMREMAPTPIYEAVASAWFVDSETEAAGRAAGAPPQDWNTPSDAEWRAASERASRPGQPEASTSAGLPRRRPGTQMVAPPRGGTSAPPNGSRDREPERVRERLAVYQQGLERGRHRASDADR